MGFRRRGAAARAALPPGSLDVVPDAVPARLELLGEPVSERSPTSRR
jgi:hypothetical protein